MVNRLSSLTERLLYTCS